MDLYFEDRKKHNYDKYFLIFLLVIIIVLILIIIIKIDVVNKKEINLENTKTEYNAEMLSTNSEQIVDKQTENSVKNAIKNTVGISKLKSPNKSIFLSEQNNLVGLGSGVIVSKKGYILTNQHVVGNKYSNCYVTLENGLNYDGNVVWSDSNIDLAIVKINATNLDSIKIGDSDNIELADDVYAIGNPIGIEFERTITKGIISGLNRTIKIEEKNENGEIKTESYMEDLLQTDATINEGNSGGPLINTKGELIGINTVKLSDVQGIGFAVPINIVKTILEKIEKNNGEYKEAYFGIYGFDKEVIRYLESNLNINNGIYIVSINKDSELIKEDIKPGDIITKIDKKEINKMNQLKEYIYSKNPGDSVEVEYLRNNIEHKKITVKLTEKAIT